MVHHDAISTQVEAGVSPALRWLILRDGLADPICAYGQIRGGTMHELLSLTLVELTARLRARQSLAGRADAGACWRASTETHDALNAVVVRRDPEGAAWPRRAPPAQRIARGEMRPLEGVPLGVKELEPVAGLSWTECSMLFADRRCQLRLGAGQSV